MNTTLITYTEAQQRLATNKRNNSSEIVRWDAGDGYVGEGYWCARRKRVITCVVTPSGFRTI